MDVAELADLYERYGYLVHARCLALLGNAAEAEDALQEVFLRVKRYDGAPATGSQASWLYAIATNYCFDQLRQRRREQPDHELVENTLEHRSNLNGHGPERAVVMRSVLRMLDPKTREIGVLHFVDGFTQEEVAAQTGYSRRTVGKKLQAFEALFRKLWTQGS